MVKITGILIILLGTTALGVYKSGQYVRRLNNLYEVKKAFFYIQGEVRYMNTPMPETLEAAAGHVKEPFRCFFYDMARKLEQKNGRDFKGIWDETVSKNISGDMLEKEAREEFFEVGSQLGCLDLKAQEKAIDYFLEKWEFIIQRRRKEKNNRLKLYYVCGIVSGLLTVMILI